MTQDNIDRAEGADGITILGDTKMDAALIEETAKRRIRVVATRTIGYDHIDLNAAKSNGVHVCNSVISICSCCAAASRNLFHPVSLHKL